MFFDVESQGLPASSNITEIGYAIFEMDGGSREFSLIEEFNEFLWDSSYPAQTAEIVELTKIDDETLRKFGKSPVAVVRDVCRKMESIDYIFAHRASFDKAIFEDKVFRTQPTQKLPPWICTLTEVPYPDKYSCRKLAHLCYDHGILVDPDTLHRALADVKLLARLILEKYKVEEIVAYARSPWVYLRAVVPAPWNDGGKGKDWAKANGYGWEAARGTDTPKFDKCWVKRVKEIDLGKSPESPYEIVILRKE